MNTDKIYAEAIANEYAPKEASKVLALKKLDMKAKSKANIFAYTFGVVMALVLGTGMCLSMVVLVNVFCNIWFEKITIYILPGRVSYNHYKNGGGYGYTIHTHIC